jgi:hypothetical protein
MKEGWEVVRTVQEIRNMAAYCFRAARDYSRRYKQAKAQGCSSDVTRYYKEQETCLFDKAAALCWILGKGEH